MIHEENSWQDVFVITIVTLPGVIAAISSLINGKHLRHPGVNHVHKPQNTGAGVGDHKSPKPHSADWYKSPKLW